jgi:hypothetical protein
MDPFVTRRFVGIVVDGDTCICVFRVSPNERTKATLAALGGVCDPTIAEDLRIDPPLDPLLEDACWFLGIEVLPYVWAALLELRWLVCLQAVKRCKGCAGETPPPPSPVEANNSFSWEVSLDPFLEGFDTLPDPSLDPDWSDVLGSA